MPHKSAIINNKSTKTQSKTKETAISNKIKQTGTKENPGKVRRVALLHKMDDSRNKLEFYL